MVFGGSREMAALAGARRDFFDNFFLIIKI
jgi:hypothetical protein